MQAVCSSAAAAVSSADRGVLLDDRRDVVHRAVDRQRSARAAPHAQRRSARPARRSATTASLIWRSDSPLRPTTSHPTSTSLVPISMYFTALAVSGLDLLDELADLLRGLARALGELAHLFGDDREAAAGLAGTCGLDGRVEGEQVGLVGDGRDHVDDLADLSPNDDRASRPSPPASRSPSRTSPIFVDRLIAWPARPDAAVRAASSLVPTRLQRHARATSSTLATIASIDADGLFDLARLQLGAVRDLLHGSGDLHRGRVDLLRRCRQLRGGGGDRLGRAPHLARDLRRATR